MNRFQANQQILKKLEEYFYNNPDMRFHQGLMALKVESPQPFTMPEDKFYEESEITLKQLEEKLNG